MAFQHQGDLSAWGDERRLHVSSGRVKYRGTKSLCQLPGLRLLCAHTGVRLYMAHAHGRDGVAREGIFKQNLNLRQDMQ